MTVTSATTSADTMVSREAWRFALSPALARRLLVLVMAVAVIAGFLVTSTEATSLAMSNAGAALTRLLRGMAMIKALLAGGAVAAVLWRLGAALTPSRFAAYALAGAAMGAGPGLIWGMVHVGSGALLLHGGLLASILLLWRDPATAARLDALVTARRASYRLRQS